MSNTWKASGLTGEKQDLNTLVAKNGGSSTSTTFFIQKNGTSDRPIAFLPILIRWWECLRAPVVVERT